MAHVQQTRGVSWWSRLRTQMAIKYVGVTLVFTLILEGLVLALGFTIITQTPVLGYFALQTADHTAQVFALQAALRAQNGALDPATSFAPGGETSLSLRKENDPPQLDHLNMDIPYVQPGGAEPDYPAFALLVDADGRVVASSYPDRYPESVDVQQVIPAEMAIINNALAGRTVGDVIETQQERHASVARAIRDEAGNILGAVYIQAPANMFPDTNILPGIVTVLIPSGVVWLCLMMPIGLLFGILTTRGMIRRVERLAGAAERFKAGDFSTRVPVRYRDELGQLEQQFNGMAEQLVDSFAQRAALAEQSARREERARIEQEMNTARYIQQSLLPEEVPDIQGWQIQPFYRPAREVGGDLFDFLPLPDGRLGIVIGDVTGKGMPAALIMATTCAMIRAAAPGAISPGKVLALVNDQLRIRITSGMFATCFYAILDPANSRLCYANAGHDIPYLAHNGSVAELRARGMPLGLMPEQIYEEQEVAIGPDDTILFYTDGLVEAHSPASEMFSFPRLQCLMKEHAHGEDMIGALLKELEHFTGEGWDQEDDITLVVVKRNGTRR